LCFLFNKIGEKGRKVLPGNKGGEGQRDGGQMTKTMYALTNIWIKKKMK
jgi:hypothetical protein